MKPSDLEDAIEAAYWRFDARRKGYAEWALSPQSERDAFKAEARILTRGAFPTSKPEIYIHTTPLPKPCEHDWAADETGQVDMNGCCTKCGMSFTRYIFTECP